MLDSFRWLYGGIDYSGAGQVRWRVELLAPPQNTYTLTFHSYQSLITHAYTYYHSTNTQIAIFSLMKHLHRKPFLTHIYIYITERQGRAYIFPTHTCEKVFYINVYSREYLLVNVCRDQVVMYILGRLRFTPAPHTEPPSARGFRNNTYTPI